MACYRIEVSRTAEKQLRRLSRPEQVRLLSAIRGFSSDPRPAGYRKLKGYDDVYRVRVGVFRVIYSIEESIVTVIILKVGHRRDIYRSTIPSSPDRRRG